MNTFGHTDSRQFALCDPREVRQSRRRFRREEVRDLERANSFYCPAGRWPSRGYILLPLSEYEQLDSWSTALQLNLGDPRNPNNVGALNNLSISNATRVTTGLDSDDNELYLIRVTDGRGVLYNEWFQAPLATFYNIRAPAYPEAFQTLSLNGGTTWTWSTMLQNIWEQMTQLGTWPGLPSSPAATPEGFWFPGVPAWTSLCDILDHLGMHVKCDLTQSNPFTIVTGGAADATFDALQTKYLSRLEDDLSSTDTGAARVPKTIWVLFRRRNSVYGTEETVRYDSFQWDESAYYRIIASAPALFSRAVGVHYIWSSFTVRYDDSGNPLDADIAMANTIAQERVTQYFAKIYRQTLGSMDSVYAGALPFTTGSQVDGVCWYSDYGVQWTGWRTNIVRGAFPPWPEVYE